MKTIAAACAALVAASSAYAEPKRPPLDLTQPSAPAPRICSQETLTIYFAPGEFELTPQATRLIDAVADDLSPCQVRSIQALALSEDANEMGDRVSLSDARAQSVIDALENAGLSAPAVESGLVVVTETFRADEAHLPLARRVDVRLGLSRPVIG
ncbi:MAG: hypothetical protein AAFQ67_06185 [Pseudomonadota bacterium]